MIRSLLYPHPRKAPMPQIDATNFTPTVLPSFSALSTGDDFRTASGVYKVKITSSAAFSYATLQVDNHSASEIVEKVKADLIITNL